MSDQDIRDLRDDIQKLTVNVAVLTQRFDDNHVTQPCEYFKQHLKEKHSDSLKNTAIKTTVNMIIVAIGSLLVLGFITYVKAG